MPPKKAAEGAPEKPNVQEIRAEIRSYIRNERDTIVKKWLALKESIKSEDYRKKQFMDRKHKEDTKSLPINVLKFIGTLKRAVRNTIRHKGGTPFSIIRSMFLYWDADKSGLINAEELLACMTSLGVKITKEECQGIVEFYAGQTGPDVEMDYHELLQDIQSGEPSLIAFVSEKEEAERDQNEIHFEEVKDKFQTMPTIVKRFLEAVREYLQRTMRNEGGTPYQHVRHLFSFYDFDYSNGLDASELQTACRKKVLLAITPKQADEIVAYYDRKNMGQITYDIFVKDVCADVKPILTFTELSPRGRAEHQKSLETNPFIPKPFHAIDNKILAKFKLDVKTALVNKVNKYGGSASSWIREAFVVWDPYYTLKVTDPAALIGACKRLGVTLSEDDARVLMHCYDRYGNGEMHYDYLAKEIMAEDDHFLKFGKLVEVGVKPSSRTPNSVQDCLTKLRISADKYVRKSKGNLQARDILHGTCVRFDTHKTGRLDINGFRNATRELHVQLRESDLADCCKWFDTNGTETLDYDEMITQMFGADVATEHLVLPKLKEATMMSTLMSRNNSLGQVPTYSLADTMRVASESGHAKSVTSLMERNFEPVESEAVKLARYKQKKNKILQEKRRVEKKLASIEEQRKKIIEDYKARKNGTSGKSNQQES